MLFRSHSAARSRPHRRKSRNTADPGGSCIHSPAGCQQAHALRVFLFLSASSPSCLSSISEHTELSIYTFRFSSGRRKFKCSRLCCANCFYPAILSSRPSPGICTPRIRCLWQIVSLAIVAAQNCVIKPQNLYSLPEHPIAASETPAEFPASLCVLMPHSQRVV